MDGSLCLAGRWPWSGCLGSSSWSNDMRWRQPFGVRAMSTCPVCLERPHEEQAYSAVEKQSANAAVRTVAG